MPPSRFLRSMRVPTRPGTYTWTPPPQPGDDGPQPIETPIERYDIHALVREVNQARHPVPMDIDPPFDATALGLKEIGNLASWTVSSCKPGCGVEALRDEDTGQFWQYVNQFCLEAIANGMGTDQTVHNPTT